VRSWEPRKRQASVGIGAELPEKTSMAIGKNRREVDAEIAEAKQ
jgi:hypothetical protein